MCSYAANLSVSTRLDVNFSPPSPFRPPPSNLYDSRLSAFRLYLLLFYSFFCTFPLPPIVKISTLLDQTVVHPNALLHFGVVPVYFPRCPCLLSQPLPTRSHIF